MRVRSWVVVGQGVSLRITTRRFTQFTDAFSKKWENHKASLALWFAFLQLLPQASDVAGNASDGGLENHVWTIQALIAESAKF
jgi:hypothetical protein